jgi:hypothetical protein
MGIIRQSAINPLYNSRITTYIQEHVSLSTTLPYQEILCDVLIYSISPADYDLYVLTISKFSSQTLTQYAIASNNILSDHMYPKSIITT